MRSECIRCSNILTLVYSIEVNIELLNIHIFSTLLSVQDYNMSILNLVQVK